MSDWSQRQYVSPYLSIKQAKAAIAEIQDLEDSVESMVGILMNGSNMTEKQARRGMKSYKGLKLLRAKLQKELDS